MQICKKCATENPVGILHCTSCGAPFDYSHKQVKPSTIETDLLFTKDQLPAVIVKSVKLGIVLLFLTPLLFFTPRVLKPQVDQSLQKDALDRFDKVIKRTKQTQTFTEKEFVYVLKQQIAGTLIKKTSDNKSVLPRDFSVDAIYGNKIKFTFKYSVFKDRMPIYCSFILTFDEVEGQTCKISVSEKRVGLLPVLGDDMFSKFTEILEGGYFYQNDLQKVLNRLKSVSTTDSKITIQTY